jgi:GTPase SAR1 family protein
MRILIIGGPKTGKTTLANRLGGNVRSTDDVKDLGWSEASAEVATWFDEPGPWVIEGVAVPRALRKWMRNNPGQPLPVDKITWLSGAFHPLTTGQQSMTKGIETVMSEIVGEVRKSVPIELVNNHIMASRQGETYLDADVNFRVR